MDFQMLYWHWLVIGMLLIIGEIFVASFTMFWFGLGGLVVALVLGLAPGLSLTWQLLIWAVSSAVFTLLWFKLVRPRMKDRTTAGIARESAIGESGQPRSKAIVAWCASLPRCWDPTNGPSFAKRRLWLGTAFL